MKKRGKENFFKQKSYLLASVLMLAAIFGMTGVYMAEQSNGKKQEARQELAQEQTVEDSAEERETAEVDQILRPQNDDFLDDPTIVSDPGRELRVLEQKEQENRQEEQPEKTEAAIEEQTENQEETAETAAGERQLHFNPETDLVWPLEGEVLMDYSMDQTVYFKTLDQYKYNPALIIKGNVNDKVVSVADGIISNIETNEETGCTVTIDMGDGYSAIYGQLKEIPYSAGDFVSAGAVVGYVSEPTKYYSLEGSNLYFQLIRNNENVNPMEYLQ